MKKLADTIVASLTVLLAQYQSPVLLWSGGRDSNLLLYFLFKAVPNIPIIQFRADWRKSQKEFIDNFILEKQLSVISFAPFDRFVLQKDGEMALVDDYLINGEKFPVLRDIVHHDHHCILRISDKRTNAFQFLYDLALVGWRRSDRQAVLDDFEPPKEIKIGQTTFFAPLFDLSDQQVAELSAFLEIKNSPFYDTKDEKLNGNNILACHSCIKKADDEEVYCFKQKKNIKPIKWDSEKSLLAFQSRFG